MSLFWQSAFFHIWTLQATLKKNWDSPLKQTSNSCLTDSTPKFSCLKSTIGKNVKYHKYWFWILNTALFLADIVFLVKLLNNHQGTLSPKILENISNFESWGLTLVAFFFFFLKKKCIPVESLKEYWNFTAFWYWFDWPQVNPNLVSIITSFAYELPHEL